MRAPLTGPDARLKDRTSLKELALLFLRLGATAFLGSFDEVYLRLPVPILITVMKKHQRYFPVVGERWEDGSAPLLPYFVGV